MNKSGGRQRLIDVDRNALIIPPLYLSLKEPTSLSRGASGIFQTNGTTSFGSSTTPRRSLTPTLTPRRSKTPPPTSVSGPSSNSSMMTRNRTPPPTKRNSLQMNRSKTPPATSRSSMMTTSHEGRPASLSSTSSSDNRRLSAPSAVGFGISVRGGSGGRAESTEHVSTENHSLRARHLPSPEQPTGRGSRIPLLALKEMETPPKEPPVTDTQTVSSDLSSHRLSVGRRSGIPQRAGVTAASPVKATTTTTISSASSS
jgi:hypothetical protein